ncbi:MAG TPA: CBS domain-containing protein [Actinomycetota bacterium]|nr:CBS domain-containing protein [Actinomycetota bacterium]
MGITKVRDVMTRDVATASPETPFKDLVRLMHDRGVSGLPIVEEGRVVGIVTEADLLGAERSAIEPRRRRRFLEWFIDRRLLERVERAAEDLRARDLMTREVVTVQPDDPVRLAIRTLLDAGVKRLPVVDEEGRLVGIVSRGDLLRPFLRSDEEIAAEIERDVIRRGLWSDPWAIRADVERGVVRLTGEVEDEEERDILLDVVRRVDGVVGVEDRLGLRAGKGGGGAP